MLIPLTNNTTHILSLDVGDRRVGIAMANSVARLARPLTTLINDETIWEYVRQIISEEQIGTLVVGLPRSLEGRETNQTAVVRLFVKQLEAETGLRIVLQDEALTSHQAEQELLRQKKSYTKGDIDALAATYILEDYLEGAKS